MYVVFIKKIMCRTHEKYFDVVQKLKLVCINVINFFRKNLLKMKAKYKTKTI